MLLKDDESVRETASQRIAAGRVIAFRTDTFYGLGADPFNRAALRGIYDLKGREERKPLLVIISDAELAGRLVKPSPLFDAVAARHWPGPITLVAMAQPEVPEELTAGTGTVGVRLPDDDEVRGFVRRLGGMLTATSANSAGKPPARTAQEVEEYFGGDELFIDGGPATGGLPSTVLDVTVQRARLIREGALPRAELERTLRDAGAELE